MKATDVSSVIEEFGFTRTGLVECIKAVQHLKREPCNWILGRKEAQQMVRLYNENVYTEEEKIDIPKKLTFVLGLKVELDMEEESRMEISHCPLMQPEEDTLDLLPIFGENPITRELFQQIIKFIKARNRVPVEFKLGKQQAREILIFGQGNMQEPVSTVEIRIEGIPISVDMNSDNLFQIVHERKYRVKSKK